MSHIDKLRTAAPDKLYMQVMHSKLRNNRPPHQVQDFSDRPHGVLLLGHPEHSSYPAADHSSHLVAAVKGFADPVEDHSLRLGFVEDSTVRLVDCILEGVSNRAQRLCGLFEGLWYQEVVQREVCAGFPTSF